MKSGSCTSSVHVHEQKEFTSHGLQSDGPFPSVCDVASMVLSAGTLFSYSTDGRTVQQDLLIAGVEMQMIEGLDTRFRRSYLRALMGSSELRTDCAHGDASRLSSLTDDDNDGNLLTDGRWRHTWDGENRLIRMESIASVPVAAKRKLVFDYDNRSRRVRKTVCDWDAGARQSRWLVDNAWLLTHCACTNVRCHEPVYSVSICFDPDPLSCGGTRCEYRHGQVQRAFHRSG